MSNSRLNLITYSNISNEAGLLEAVRSNYISKIIGPNSIFVYTDESTQDIFNRIENFSVGGSLLVSEVSLYFGALPIEVWDWIEARSPNLISIKPSEINKGS